MHEFSATGVYGGTYRHGADALFSAAKNLNIHSSIRSISETLFAPAIASTLETRGFRWEPYVTGSPNATPGRSSITFHEASSDAKLGRNAMGLTQCISFLCETRGIGLGAQHFARRTATALTMVEAILQTAADNASEVLRTVTCAVDKFVNSTADIVIADRSTPSTRLFTMVDTSTGCLAQVPVTFISTTPTTPTLTRRRPLAYLIPASHAHLTARLAVSDVEVHTVPSSYCSQNPTSALTLTSTTFSGTYYEGVVPVKVTTTTSATTDSACTLDLSPGSFLVTLRQKNAALASSAIEPEGNDSWVSTNILPVRVGAGDGEREVYAVLRITRNGKG